ncbi:MAG: prepilin peptidase, partial [Candidatus Nealsonbacteria bacterium]|nr:prepilin peptidase [Candidatus Nealsonbacteria bacterium]
LRFDLLGRSNLLISGFGAAAFFLAIVLVSRGRWMGVGDIKLAFLMGLVLGYPNILAALFLAFLIGAIMGVGLIIFGKKTMKSEVPFGPFLIGGTFAALFWGEKIISWYVQSFHIN